MIHPHLYLAIAINIAIVVLRRPHECVGSVLT